MRHRVDTTRLRATLGAPELSRLLDALQRRFELGRPLSGMLTLPSCSVEARSAIDAILGRKSSRGNTLRLDLDELAATLRAASICDDLGAALQALRGPLTDRRAAIQQISAAWNAVWREARKKFSPTPTLDPWLAKLQDLGIVRRLCGDDPAAGATLLDEIARVVVSLPVHAEPLAAFAARLFGDAHALDAGSPRATLAVRAAARLGNIQFKDDAEGRRAAWAGVGVMLDELSTPVLVYNLATEDDTPSGRLLRSAKGDHEPVHVSLHLLLRYPLGVDSGLSGRRIFVCENPTIVSLAAGRLGEKCAPLICVNGQFATPTLVLLRQLRACGARLAYHGDFDPAGITIARRVMQECGAEPWRFGAGDYATALKGPRFSGLAPATPWDHALQEAVNVTRRVVHEESRFAVLAEDLARDGRRSV